MSRTRTSVRRTTARGLLTEHEPEGDPLFSVVNGKLMRSTATARFEVSAAEAAKMLNLAAELLITGMKLKFPAGPALCVVEKKDRSDPHYRLCEALGV